MGEFVNSTQARFDKSFVSCGVLEVHHLPTGGARKTLYSIANALYHKANPRPVAFVIFSDVIKSKDESRGQRLAAEIAENAKCGASRIGMLMMSPVEVNPRTGNKICLWILIPHHENFRKWYTEETMHRVDSE